MSSLTGSVISATYDQLLTLPSGGGDGTNLRAITDGDGVTTFALKMSTDKVDIQGGLEVGVNGTGYDVKFYGDTATNGYMLWDQSTDDLILGTSSRLGIGTTSPNAPLHLKSTAQTEMLKIDTANFIFQLGEDADLDNFCRLRLNSGDGFHFTGNDDGPDLTILSASGNVGVGTAAPASKFHVTGTVQVGVDDTGHDVKFYGATSGAYMLWDESEDRLYLNQATDDSAIFVAKSTDVGHGLTDYAETDAYFSLHKSGDNSGAVNMKFFADDDGSDTTGVRFWSFTENTLDTTKSTGGQSQNEFIAQMHNGSNALANVTADGNVFGVKARRGGSIETVFIVDEDGDIHADAGGGDLSTGAGYTTVKTYDEYNDAHLVRAIDMNQSSVSAGLINSEFDKFVEYNSEKLADLKLIGREKDGTPNHFINVTGMQRLHNGAIWQQYEEHQKLLNAFVKLAEKTVGLEEAKALIEDNEIKKLG